MASSDLHSISSDSEEILYCPITCELFRDPVVAEDGHLYEREAIVRWITEHGTSPFTRQPLNADRLESNEHIKIKAGKQRALSVTYNRDLDQVELPPIRSSHNSAMINMRRYSLPPHRHANVQHPYTRLGICNCVGERIDNCVLFILNRIACIFILCCMFTIYGGVIVGFTVAILKSKSNPTKPLLSCSPINYKFTSDACVRAYRNLVILDSGTCTNFPYTRKAKPFRFQALSSTTTIIFAFQQKSGSWNIDNITLWDSMINENVFHNGGFESGTLSPDYRQCHSTGSVTNYSSFNGQYSFSDNTSGEFGYLMQNVSTSIGTTYYLWFYLQNRNTTRASFMLLLNL